MTEMVFYSLKTYNKRHLDYYYHDTKLLQNGIDFLVRIEETPQGIKQLHNGLCKVNLPFTGNFQHENKDLLFSTDNNKCWPFNMKIYYR